MMIFFGKRLRIPYCKAYIGRAGSKLKKNLAFKYRAILVAMRLLRINYY